MHGNGMAVDMETKRAWNGAGQYITRERESDREARENEEGRVNDDR